MQFITRGRWFIAVGVVAVVVLLYGGLTNNSSSYKTSVEVETPTVYASSTSIPLRVGGVVGATNEVTIYAQATGVVEAVPAIEGMSVTTGQLLVQQSQPVVAAKLGLTAAEGELSSLQQTAAVVEAGGASQKSEVKAYTAAEAALVRIEADQNRLAEVGSKMQTTLESGLISSIEAIDFINQNSALFTRDALRDFDEVVEDIYGRTPNYFSRSVKYGSTEESSDLSGKIKSLKESDGKNIILAQTYGTVLRKDLNRLLDIYAEAEADVYDRTDGTDDDTKTEYEANRAAILANLATLDETQAAAQAIADSALANSVMDEQSVTVTAVDEAVAKTVADYAARINNQVEVVDQAAQAVMLAELSLGQSRAPFPGVVTDVFVDTGDYATPGTPLLKLSGTEARELLVTAPTTLASSLEIGQEFVVDEQVVGNVASFSSVSNGGSVPVTIVLSNTDLPIGVSVVGHINLAVTDGLVAIPRQYVFFSTTGSYVQLESGKKESFDIIYDDGSLLYGKSDVSPRERLVQATGIHF